MIAQNMTIDDVRLLELPKIRKRAGNITSVNNGMEIPFDIQRVFYLYDIPGGADRGAHAHRICTQFLVAAGGSFTVCVDDGRNERHILLNQPYKGLLIPPGIWASEVNFSSGSTCLVLASHTYDEGDYIREYQEFLSFKNE